MVLLITEADHAIPLACFDANKKLIDSGAPCLELIPAGATVMDRDGERSKAVRREDAVCEGAGSETASYRVDGAAAGLVMWPEGAWKNAGYQPLENSAETLPSNERNKLEAAARAASPNMASSDLVEIRVAGEVDLDGDGLPERLYGVTAHPIKNAGGADWSAPDGYSFSGLLHTNGNAPDRVVIDQTSDLERYEPIGTLALDGSGRRQLIVTASYYEGDAVEVLKMPDAKLPAGNSTGNSIDGKLIQVGVYGCGA